MNNEILGKAPYYDDYDPSKKYVQILSLPGRVAQSREFSQSQTTLLDLMKRLGNAILRDGSVVDGMGFTINETGTQITVESGSVYVQGIVHQFDGGSVNITGIGEENIGVKLTKSIVTEADDPTLRDPAQGYANYSQPGAHRLKQEIFLTVNDPTAHTMYSFVDGLLKIDPVRPQLDAVLDLLAGRTYDEIGNYKVHGLDLWAERKNEDAVYLIVEAGKAYVRGYSVSKPSASRITINKAMDTRNVFNEPKTYKTEVPKYYFNNNPVHSILKTVATIEVTGNITRGSVSGGIDTLPKSPVVEIVSVKQGGTTYVEGTDFQLASDGLDWSLSGAEPSTGTTYQATYRYNKVLVEGVDYKLSSEGEEDNLRHFLEFISGGDKPVVGTQIVTDYKFFLARADLVTLNQHGDIIIIPGQSDVLSRVNAPTHTDPDTLKLGVLVQPPNSDKPRAITESIMKLNMGDLQDVVSRVKDMEYNQALTALDQEALNAESGTSLKGIFSDGFGSTARGDLGHPDFSVMYNLQERFIELPLSTTTITKPEIPSNVTGVAVWGRLVTAPFTDELEISQPYATGIMNVNPYNVFTQMGTLNLNPAVDNWIDEEIVVEGEPAALKILGSSGATPSSKATTTRTTTWKGNVGTTTSTTSRTILEEAITFMRQTEVNIEADNLFPSSDNLELIFDGQKVNLTPTSITTPGTVEGTVRSTVDGTVTAKFTVPAGVRTGTREVLLRNAHNTASASYTAQGQRKVIGQSVLITRVTRNLVDPLAQSFVFTSNKTISSVGLYFHSKDTTKNVIVQIRNMVNGFPGQEIHAETVLKPSQVNISSNSSVETRVRFDSPVVCSPGVQYCIMLLTDSDEYMMHIAEMGKLDVITGQPVTRQPYNEGVLFSSSNALTWTPHQTKDLKFKVYTAKFSKHGLIEFEPIVGVSVDKILLLADQLTPTNTGCEWGFRTSADGEFKPISSYEDLDLGELVEFIQLRAVFESSINMSPILAIDSFNLLGFLTEQEGSYISRNTEYSQVYTEVKQVFEAKIPSGCTVVPQFSYDGVTWVDGILSGSQQITNEFTQYTYITPVDIGQEAKNFRARLNITSPNSILRPQARRFMNIVR